MYNVGKKEQYTQKTLLREALDKQRCCVTDEIADEVCVGCYYYNNGAVGTKSPCDRFSSKSFYYDHTIKRFWCRSWE